MPHAYFEKLKQTPVLIGHERCASSSFCESGTLIVCATHGHGLARNILHNGRYYLGCRECIEEQCQVVAARTEEKARGVWENLRE
jgi:hypothetical protein